MLCHRNAGNLLLGKEEMNTTKLNNSENFHETANLEYRKPAWLLIACIVFVPFIGAFVTLRRGYSKKVRAISFIWLIIYIMGSAGSPSKVAHSNGARQNAVESSQPADPNAQFHALSARIRQSNTSLCGTLADHIDNIVERAAYLDDKALRDWMSEADSMHCFD
jgi:hypothetical protein